MSKKIVFTRSLTALRHIVSKDDTRPVLQEISIRSRDGKPVAVATNGQQVWAVDVYGKDGETVDTGFTFAAEILNKFKKAVKKKNYPDITLTVDDKKASFDYEGGTATAESEDGSYPDVGKIWPPMDSDYQPVGLGCEVLEDLVKMIKEAGIKAVELWIPVNKERSLVVSGIPAKMYDLDGHTLTGVVMPARVNDIKFPAKTD